MMPDLVFVFLYGLAVSVLTRQSSLKCSLAYSPVLHTDFSESYCAAVELVKTDEKDLGYL